MKEQVTMTEAGTAALELLGAVTTDGRARSAALAAMSARAQDATSVVTYSSRGQLLIIGPQDKALEAAESLKARVRCAILAGDGKARKARGETAARGSEKSPKSKAGVLTIVGGVPVVHARLASLTGHLGGFAATIVSPDGEANLAQFLGERQEHFDLVLDLGTSPCIKREILPPGYYAPGQSKDALQRALADIPEMVGEFEKPKYFNYNPDICAHGASGLKGCTRCIEACPTKAIVSIGDKVEVDPYLCQGAGACVAVCPSGAMTYAYPTAQGLLDVIRALLKTYREAGGRNPCVLFHDHEHGRQTVAHLAAALPERVIPVEIEETGSVGMDVWLATLAYGANQVALLTSPAVPGSVLYELRTQVDYAQAILEGMGYARERVQLITAADDASALAALNALAAGPESLPATFAPIGEKRTTIRLAVDHLYAHAPSRRAFGALPEGAPFGEIKVNRQTCTLCMACVGICPASALSDGSDLPQLIFYEGNCVQCGLCETACPEDAITRWPRFAYEPELRQESRILNEDKPFCCVVCGKPFATQRVLDRMTDKLKGHWMFQNSDALRRLQMCDECRVKDMLVREGGLMDAHRKP